MGIGVDIIEIERIERMLKKYPNFRSKIFSAREIAYCEQKKYPAPHYAARFAAKESIMKALGTGWVEPVRWKDLEIVDDPSGKPLVNLKGGSRLVGNKMGIKEIMVSLSHCKAYAVAIARLIGA